MPFGSCPCAGGGCPSMTSGGKFAPSKGKPFDTAIELTPGNALTRDCNSLRKPSTFAPSSGRALTATCIASTFCGLKPGFTWLKRQKLLTSKTRADEQHERQRH